MVAPPKGMAPCPFRSIMVTGGCSAEICIQPQRIIRGPYLLSLPAFPELRLTGVYVGQNSVFLCPGEVPATSLMHHSDGLWSPIPFDGEPLLPGRQFRVGLLNRGCNSLEVSGCLWGFVPSDRAAYEPPSIPRLDSIRPASPAWLGRLSGDLPPPGVAAEMLTEIRSRFERLQADYDKSERLRAEAERDKSELQLALSARRKLLENEQVRCRQLEQAVRGECDPFELGDVWETAADES
jgi:hypothetical protein